MEDIVKKPIDQEELDRKSKIKTINRRIYFCPISAYWLRHF